MTSHVLLYDEVDFRSEEEGRLCSPPRQKEGELDTYAQDESKVYKEVNVYLFSKMKSYECTTDEE